MAKHKTPQEVFELCAKIHNNFYDYSKSVYLGAKTKMEIICPKEGHGSFWQQPYDHYGKKKCGCPKCGDERTGVALKMSKDDQLAEFSAIHGDTYDYSEAVIIDNRTEIKIICKVEGHLPFWQKPNTHKNGHGCKKCSNIIVSGKLLADFEEQIKLANIIHNNAYDYSQYVYEGNKTPSTIICHKENHGMFQQTFNSHLSGNGCAPCGIERNVERLTSNKEEFIEKAEKLYPGKYTFEKFIYKTCHDLGIITCVKHGDFEQFPARFLNGIACQECSKISYHEKRSLGLEIFLERANKIHDNKYSYNKITIWKSVETKVEIFCPISTHGYFLQTPHAHMGGQGCPLCIHTISDGCIAWLDSLNIPNDVLHREVPIRLEANRRKIKADGYIAETNTIYEYHGDYWHGNPNNPKFPHDDIHPEASGKTFGDLYKGTIERENRIKAAGFNLITIWESDWLSFLSDQQTLLLD